MKDSPMHSIQEIIDNRNVADQFKGMSTDILIGEQEKLRCELVTVAINLTQDFNKSSVMRTHSSYAGSRFILLNKPNTQRIGHPEGGRKWDKRGAVGTHHYNTVEHYDIYRYEELFNELRADGYKIYAVDNIAEMNPESVYDVKFPLKTVLIMGEEQTGIPKEIIEAADSMVYIPQRGVSPRSLNVAVAHGILAYTWGSQHLKD